VTVSDMSVEGGALCQWLAESVRR